MKFTVLEPDGRAHEFVLTGDKLGQEALDKVRSTPVRRAEVANYLWFDHLFYIWQTAILSVSNIIFSFL